MPLEQIPGDSPAAVPAEPASRSGRVYVLAAMLALLTLLAYRNSLVAPFVFDDLLWIVEGHQVRHLSPVGALLTQSPRPVWMLTLALNFAWEGLEPRGYHLVNLAIHVAAGLVLFGLVRRTLALAAPERYREPAATWLGFAAALIWLLHPLQTESVTYVVQRCESLMGLFYLLSLYAVLRGATGRHGWPWYILAIVSVALGVGTKEVMATAPVVILLYDRVFLSRSWGQLLRQRGWMYLLFVPALGWLWLRVRPALDPDAEPGSAGLGVRSLTPWMYLRSQAGVLLHYLRLCFWPRPLCLDYHWPIARTASAIYLPGAAILGLLAASLAGLRFRPALGFLGLAFFLILAPSSSVVPIVDLAFEHRMYLSLAAVIVLVVLGVHAILERSGFDPAARRMATLFGLLLVGGACFVATSQRNRQYCEAIEIWAQTVSVAPHNYRAHFNLGRAYGQRGDYEQERRHYEEALRLNPRYAKGYANLGVLLAREGKLDEAIVTYQKALELRPNYALVCRNYANLLARKQEYEGALALFQQAIKIAPRDPQAHCGRAMTLQRQGKAAEAIAAYRQTLELRPDLLQAQVQLAWLLATAEQAELRSGDEAVQLAEQLLQRPESRADFAILDVLAAAYAETGRFDEARKTAERAARLAGEKGKQDEQAKILARAALYRSRQPYRDKLEDAKDPPQETPDDGMEPSKTS